MNGGLDYRYQGRRRAVARSGKWAIAARKCVIEWNGVLGEFPLPKEAPDAYAATGVPKRDRSDPSYQRPMEISRPKFILPF